MAEIKKKFGSVKRYGSRYGKRLKDKVADIERRSKKPSKCPVCRKPSAKRVAAGIWQCKKCSSKFAGAAYYLEEKVSATKMEVQEKATVFRSKKTAEEAE